MKCEGFVEIHTKLSEDIKRSVPCNYFADHYVRYRSKGSKEVAKGVKIITKEMNVCPNHYRQLSLLNSVVIMETYRI